MELTRGRSKGGVNASIKGKKNRWKRGRLPDHEVFKKENNKSTKLLGRGQKTGTTHVILKEGLVRHVRKVLLDMSGSSSCKFP